MTATGRVLVTDAARGSAIAIIRSLGRSGFDVIAADSDPRSPGFRSRYTSDQLVYPPPTTDSGGVVAALLRAAREYPIDLIIPVTDEVILPLSDARERFAGVSLLALPDPSALAVVGDKFATLLLADRLGIATPRSALVTSVREACERAPTLGWPVVLKPRASRVQRQDGTVEAFEVAYARDAPDLAMRMEQFEGRCTVLLQEYCRGEGHGVELLLHRGRPLAAFQHRRLHEVPITGGASSLRESVRLDEQLFAQAVCLLQELEWTGLAMVEFRVGPDGPRLMEVNGRVWGSLPLAVRSGMDFPARLADLYLSGPPGDGGKLDTSYRVGVRSRNLELEIAWIGSVVRGNRRYPFLQGPKRRAALAAGMRLFSPRDGYDIVCRDDPRPGLAEVAKVARKLVRKTTHRP